ncbi:MAG TPA: DUF6306 domain-containing protein [Sphingomonadaceae bacterium]|nr:DUF6306 domain-containing protein [Sphingomonadaceae bacterium]
MDRDAIIAALDELLEAERAGARVALASAKGLPDTDALSPLIHTIHHDEAHWCAMLAGEIERLRAEPSPRVGAFYGKAMAIENLGERMTFLNRGQNWVVRKLDALIPEIEDETLRTRLADMRQGHVDNIDRTTRILAGTAAD